MSRYQGSRDPERAARLSALLAPLRTRLREVGMSHGQLAIRVGRDRSRVSRALSGNELPSLALLEMIAGALGGIDETVMRRRWAHLAAMRRKDRISWAGGGPPGELRNHADLLLALRQLLADVGLSQRELVRNDRSGLLRHSTVGAVLRGQRGARRDLVIAIVRACGVTDRAEAAWVTAWFRYGQPDLAQRHQRRREGYDRRKAAEWKDWV